MNQLNQLSHIILSHNAKNLQQILPEAWWTTHPSRSSKLGMICDGGAVGSGFILLFLSMLMLKARMLLVWANFDQLSPSLRMRYGPIMAYHNL